MVRQKQFKPPQNKAKIIIVDDHPIVRQGLTELINHENDLVVCCQAEDASEAMEFIKESDPDIIIVDISLKETSGLELIKDIKVRYPRLPVLVLSMHDESLYAERSLRAGARGYIMKQEATDKVITAIRKVLMGESYISDKMTAKMVDRLVGGTTESSPVNALSDRELEVFDMLGQGHGTRYISEKLHLSIKTIETYRAHIKRKLNLSDATELIQHAVQWVNART